MCVCMCMYIYIYIFIYTYMCVCICISSWYMHMYFYDICGVYVWVCVCACVSRFVGMCEYLLTCVYVSACMYARIQHLFFLLSSTWDRQTATWLFRREWLHGTRMKLRCIFVVCLYECVLVYARVCLIHMFAHIYICIMYIYNNIYTYIYTHTYSMWTRTVNCRNPIVHNYVSEDSTGIVHYGC